MFGTELGAPQTNERGRIESGDDTCATVRVTSHFAARLEEIGQADEEAFGRLMDFLQDKVMPTLARAPKSA